MTITCMKAEASQSSALSKWSYWFMLTVPRTHLFWSVLWIKLVICHCCTYNASMLVSICTAWWSRTWSRSIGMFIWSLSPTMKKPACTSYLIYTTIHQNVHKPFQVLIGQKDPSWRTDQILDKIIHQYWVGIYAEFSMNINLVSAAVGEYN